MVISDVESRFHGQFTGYLQSVHCQNLDFGYTQTGKVSLLWDGHSYCMHRKCKQNGTVWRCRKSILGKVCSAKIATIKLRDGSYQVLLNNIHNHVSPVRKSKAKLEKLLKRKVKLEKLE